MASISKDKPGSFRIQFFGCDGKRKTLRVRGSRRTAETIGGHIDEMLTSRKAGHAPANATVEWVRDRDDEMKKKLARIGLIPKPLTATLAGFIDDYTASRADVKQATQLVYTRVRKHLLEHFVEDRRMDTITRGDADAWFQYMKNTDRAEATIRKSVRVVRQWWAAAIRQGLARENVFDHITASVRANEARQRFVTIDEIEKVIDAAPDVQWKAMIGLARYGALRCPSEVLRLKWTHVNWERERLTIPSPKTERQGRSQRIIPLFPRLRELLMDAFTAADEGDEYVITRYRDASQNLVTQMRRTITKAGMIPWPKAWQNLRASRATELAAIHPAHTVADWCGHTVQVAQEFYLTVTEADFAKAIKVDGAQVAQKAAHNAPADARTGEHGRSVEDRELAKNPGNNAYLHGDARECAESELVSSGPYRT